MKRGFLAHLGMTLTESFSASPQSSTRAGFLCTHRLEVVNPKSAVKGSFIIELGLWLTVLIWWPLIFLGVLYSIWRITSRHKECPKCTSTEFVPLDSERARQLRRRAS